MINHWRDTMLFPRFFMVDARAVIGLTLFLLNMAWWTFFVAVASMTLFWFLERKGLSFSHAFLRVRAWICGVNRPARPAWKNFRRIEYHVG